MANPRTLRTGLADRLKTLTGLNVYERWPGQLNPPCAIVSYTGGEPEQTMGRGDLTRWDFEVDLLIPLAGGWENAQDRLDPLLATSSTGGVYGALNADRTLGGSVDTVFVQGLEEDQQFEVGDGIAALGAAVEIEVWST